MKHGKDPNPDFNIKRRATAVYTFKRIDKATQSDIQPKMLGDGTHCQPGKRILIPEPPPPPGFQQEGGYRSLFSLP